MTPELLNIILKQKSVYRRVMRSGGKDLDSVRLHQVLRSQSSTLYRRLKNNHFRELLNGYRQSPKIYCTPSITLQVVNVNEVFRQYHWVIWWTILAHYFIILGLLVNSFVGQTTLPRFVISNRSRNMMLNVLSWALHPASHLDQMESVLQSWNLQQKRSLACSLFCSTSHWLLEKFHWILSLETSFRCSSQERRTPLVLRTTEA